MTLSIASDSGQVPRLLEPFICKRVVAAFADAVVAVAQTWRPRKSVPTRVLVVTAHGVCLQFGE